MHKLRSLLSTLNNFEFIWYSIVYYNFCNNEDFFSKQLRYKINIVCTQVESIGRSFLSIFNRKFSISCKTAIYNIHIRKIALRT